MKKKNPQHELSENEASFDVETELGKQAIAVMEARDEIALAKKHYEGCEAKMISLLKKGERNEFKHEGRSLSLRTTTANESIAVRTI